MNSMSAYWHWNIKLRIFVSLTQTLSICHTSMHYLQVNIVDKTCTYDRCYENIKNISFDAIMDVDVIWT